MTYRELCEKSDNLAAYLDSRLEGSKTPVVVYGHKDPYMLVCFLACVKSGRAYCPVDISVPAERIKDIIEVTKSPVILAVNPLPFNTSDVMDLNKIKDESHTHKTALSKDKYVGSDDIFYIIFTSGSTGKPKGVCITEDCLYNFVNWAVTLTNINPLNKKTVFLNQAPFSFDLSVMDLFLSLYTGGTLFCLDKTTQTNPTALMSALQASNAEVWVSTPSFANLCLAYNVFDSALMPNVDTFLFCGETLTNNTAKSLLERFPKAKVVNTYGPTESTVAVTGVEITSELCEKQSPLPVGRAKKGTKIIIADSNGTPLSDGQCGEIIIAGDSVAKGYFASKEQTEKCFFTYGSDDKEERAYKTGDAGYLENGMLYYGGRIDLQVKLHGYRIEMGDIESNLMKIPGIKNAVVVYVEKENSEDFLAAFITPKPENESTLKASVAIKKALAAYLPAYMIPKKFVFVDEIPMTNNGKADRVKLKKLI